MCSRLRRQTAQISSWSWAADTSNLAGALLAVLRTSPEPLSLSHGCYSVRSRTNSMQSSVLASEQEAVPRFVVEVAAIRSQAGGLQSAGPKAPEPHGEAKNPLQADVCLPTPRPARIE